ncbi:hypothetical protein SLE2022_043150 [Rubroshorea leprosula]
MAKSKVIFLSNFLQLKGNLVILTLLVVAQIKATGHTLELSDDSSIDGVHVNDLCFSFPNSLHRDTPESPISLSLPNYVSDSDDGNGIFESPKLPSYVSDLDDENGIFT